MVRYLLTLQAPDKTGLVEQLATAISRHGGSWLDSELRHINGIFAAILIIEVHEGKWPQLLNTLTSIDSLTLTYAKTSKEKQPLHRVSYTLVACDRPGLVLDISNQINKLEINIEQFSSQYESASHTGIALFRANFSLGMKTAAKEEQLTQSIYSLGDDIILDKVTQ